MGLDIDRYSLPQWQLSFRGLDGVQRDLAVHDGPVLPES
jgi:hypothetical protein